MRFAYERSAQANLLMSSASAPLGDPFHQPSGPNEVVKSALKVVKSPEKKAENTRNECKERQTVVTLTRAQSS